MAEFRISPLPSSWQANKYSFYSQYTSLGNIELIEKQAAQFQYPDNPKTGYALLTDQSQLIEEEFLTLFAALKKNPKMGQQFWFFLLYCCSLLETWCIAYGNPREQRKYRQLKQNILLACTNGRYQEQRIQRSLLAQVQDGLLAFLSIPLHSSQTRDLVALVNGLRVHITFCRLTVKNILLFAEQRLWLQQINTLFDIHIEPLSMDKYSPTFARVGFVLFAANLLIDCMMIVKHSLFPSPQEEGMLMSDRFWYDLDKRHTTILSNLVWTISSALTAFREFFGLSVSMANAMIAVGLLFDLFLLRYRLGLAQQHWQMKSRQFDAEWLDLETKRTRHVNGEWVLQKTELDTTAHQWFCLKQQRIELESQWQKTSAEFSWSIVAATLFVLGLASTLLFSSPIMTAFCFLTCILATTMYATYSLYGTYAQKNWVLTQETNNTTARQIALRERQEAWDYLIATMIKTSIFPQIFLLLYAASLPAALSFTALYAAYELSKNVFENTPTPILTQEKESEEAMQDQIVLQFCQN